MPDKRILTVRVALRGRPVRTCRFDQETVTVGRDPESDIFLDNPAVSRAHARIVRTSVGHYAVEDLGSANGTFVNDEQIRREFVMNNDVIVIGKYSLTVAFEAGQRQSARSSLPSVTAKTYDGTTVLSRAELQSVVEHAQEERQEPVLRLVEQPVHVDAPSQVHPTPLSPAPAAPAAPARPARLPVLIGGVVLGVLAGVFITLALLR